MRTTGKAVLAQIGTETIGLNFQGEQFLEFNLFWATNSFIFLRENDWIMGTGASELPKNVCTQGTDARFRARVQGLDLVLGRRLRAQILTWVLEKTVYSC